MFGLGIPELLVIFVIALIVFGPKKLPELGKSIGRAMSEFKRATDEFQDQVRTEMKEVEKTADIKDEIKQIGDGLHTALKDGPAPWATPESEPGKAEKQAEKSYSGPEQATPGAGGEEKKENV